MGKGYDFEEINELIRDTLNSSSLIMFETGNVSESPDSTDVNCKIILSGEV
jgi:hypothetical protein